MRNSASIFYNVWNFSPNVKETLKKVRLNSCRTDVLYNCNRLLIGLNLNFDSILAMLLYGKIYSLRVTFGVFSEM